jgi:tetratricopeptide (TPR) repeat protein
VDWGTSAGQLNPHDPFLYLFHLGITSHLRGQYEEAVVHLKKALSRNPNFLPAHVNLAFVYSELGRGEEAHAEAVEVLRLNPEYSLEVTKRRLPFKDSTVFERFLAGLRKAGLK